MAVTDAPKRARLSDRSPPPQPTSKALFPCNGPSRDDEDDADDEGRDSIMNRIRMGFIPANGFFRGSHHNSLIAENFETSSYETDDETHRTDKLR